MGASLRRVETARERERFIRLPEELYRGVPGWFPPLYSEMRALFDAKKNPFFEHAEGALWLAEKDGRALGRISAQVCREHLRVHKDEAGFFGAFDCADDAEAASALFGAAESWLRERGMKRARGPFTLSINEESGLLVDGFDTPPYLLMGHAQPHYARLVEANGYRKVKDLIAWRYAIGEAAEGARQVAEEARKVPGLHVRTLRRARMREDIAILMEVFNSAWSSNWGFVPLTRAELEKSAKDLSLIIEPELALIAEIDGQPAAIALALPNINEALHDLGGRLFPFGIFKLLWRVKVRGLRSARLILLGIKPEFRKRAGPSGALSVLLYVEMNERARRMGYREGELSWTLEDNERINRGIEFMGGVRYKTYRVYEKEL